MRSLVLATMAALLLLSGCGKKEEAAEAPALETAATEAASSEKPADGRTWCDELQRMVSDEDCTLARELVARAEQGVGAFNAPATIQRGDTVRIQLVLALAPPPPPPPPAPETSPVDADVAMPPETAPEAPAPAEGGTREPATVRDEVRHAPKPPPTPAETVAPLPGETVEFTPVVGRHMAAELSGEGFDIVPKSPRAQDVLPDSQTSWEWDVTARVKGPHTLTLKTLVEAEFADGQRYALRSLSTNKTIEVTVTPMGQVSDAVDAAVEWLGKTTNLLTALAGTIAAAVAVWAALRRRKD